MRPRLDPRIARGRLSVVGALVLVTLASIAPAESSPVPTFVHSVQETLRVPEREDHSPFLLKTPSGAPALVWVATAPDTNVAGRFDEVAYSDREGGVWGTPIVLAGPTPAIFTPELAFDADGGRWISWAEHDGTDSKIRLRRDLGGETWNFTLDDATQPDLEPSICADDSGGVVVVWQGWRTDNYEILLAAGDENGFTTPQVISSSPLNDREPEVVWGNSQAWIVWSTYQNPAYNLISRRYNGVDPTPPVTLTTSYRARNLHPKIAWDDANDVLWTAFLWINQDWDGFNEREIPGLYDTGTGRIRAFDGTQILLPNGLNPAQQFPRVGMNGLGYTRFNYDGTLSPDRNGEGMGVVALPNGGVEVFHKQKGMIPEGNVANFYWSVTGTNYAGNSWSSPTDFLELRTSFAWEEPGVVVANDTLWVAWSADARTPAIQSGLTNPNLFGHDANISVRGVPVDTTSAGPAGFVSLGDAPEPSTVSAMPHPQFTVTDSSGVRTLLWGDNHRHSVDLSWDGYADPGIKQTIFYSQDWLGHDFMATSDHAERYSKAVWAFVAQTAMIYDIPNRYRLFPGYERSMRAGNGSGDQNQFYREPAQFTEASAAYPANNDWHVMYDAEQGIDVLSVPHTPAQCGAIIKWQELAAGHPDSLPAPLRVAEVYQALRKSFEYPGCPDQTDFCTVGPDSGWVSLALALGMKVGLIAASDHSLVAGYIGTLSASLSREDIWQSLHDRHCFGASRNGKMNVDFRVSGALMGTELVLSDAPTIFIHAESQSPLTFLEVNKNGNANWFAISSFASDTSVTYVDPDVNTAGTRSFYYLRARDYDGRTVWTSPVWVLHTGPPFDPGTDAALVAPGLEDFAIKIVPNPSAGPVSFVIRGVASGGGTLRVYDLGGRLMREMTLAGGSSTRTVSWDRRDEAGHRAAAGVYYAVAQSGGKIQSEKLVVLR